MHNTALRPAALYTTLLSPSLCPQRWLHNQYTHLIDIKLLFDYESKKAHTTNFEMANT